MVPQPSKKVQSTYSHDDQLVTRIQSKLALSRLKVENKPKNKDAGSTDAGILF